MTATDQDLDDFRAYLEEHNGIRGLEIVEPGDLDRAVRIFDRDGFVVIGDALTPAQTQQLHEGSSEVVEEILALDPDRTGNRGSHRYSFGASSSTRSMLHRAEWQMLIDLPTITPLLTALFGSDAYRLRSGSGDFCLPGAVEYQRLHADMGDYRDPERTPYSSFADRRGFLSTRELPIPYICVNFLPVPFTRLNGPTRQIPATQHSRAPFPTPDDEPEWMRLSTVCPAPAGAALVRDVRAWHGGTPNVSNHIRAMPNVEFYAPWFREPITRCISHEDHQHLSPHARAITEFVVADSGDDLDVTLALGPTPRPRK